MYYIKDSRIRNLCIKVLLFFKFNILSVLQEIYHFKKFVFIVDENYDCKTLMKNHRIVNLIGDVKHECKQV